MSDGSEPTVEEILQSIKQVIARDNRAAAAETRARREAEGLAAARIEPVREAIEARSESLDADVLDLAEAGEFLGETDNAESEDALISNETQASMRDSLAALAMLSEPGAAPKIVRSGETSVEDLMRELLRPALAEWLDKNLPAVVERMVAAEIRRASGRKD
ncbi:MAG: DUF2497 domain-containing protein [Sphingomonadaceae bacterium]